MKTHRFYKILVVMFSIITLFNSVSFALVLYLHNGWFRMPSTSSAGSYKILSGTFYARIHTDKHAVKAYTRYDDYKCIAKSWWRPCAKKKRNGYRIYRDGRDIGNLYVGDTYLYYKTPYYSEKKKKEEERDDEGIIPRYTQYYDEITGYAGSWEGSTWLKPKTLKILELEQAIPIRIHRAVGDYPIIDLAYLNLNVTKLPPPPSPQEPKKDIVPEPRNFLIFLLGTLVFLFPQNVSRFR